MADSFQVPPEKPIIVKIIQPPQDRTGLSQLAHVIYSVVGLVGVSILVAVAAGLVVGSIMFWLRRRATMRGLPTYKL